MAKPISKLKAALYGVCLFVATQPGVVAAKSRSVLLGLQLDNIERAIFPEWLNIAGPLAFVVLLVYWNLRGSAMQGLPLIYKILIWVVAYSGLRWLWIGGGADLLCAVLQIRCSAPGTD